MDNYADMLRVEGINSKGFGTIPKMVVRDRRLSPLAKAIYSYFAAFCGNGSQAFPRRDTVIADLGISKNTYHKHLNMLKELGYVKITQRTQHGKFMYNIYTLPQNPKAIKPITKTNSPCTNICDTAEKAYTDSKPCTNICDTVEVVKKDMEPCTNICDTAESPCTKNRDTKNWDTNNINSIGNINSIYPSFVRDNVKDTEGEEDFVHLIKDNIHYNQLIDRHEKCVGILDSMVMLMADVLSSSAPAYKIGGIMVEADSVKKRIMSLTYKHISWLLMTLGDNSAPIYSFRNYLLTVLYNAPITTGLDKHIRAKQIANAIGR